MSSSVTKATAERHQRILLDLLKLPGNDVCADCRSRNPRWASWNLGVFICVKCAGIHRKLGTHITKVKSLTLDSWTKEQVQCMKQFGNIKSNHIFNPNEAKNPPPTDFEESERDSQLERYIRNKYESKRFIEAQRRNESVGSCSASVSSGVSFTMSNSPTHSPASSIYQQPSMSTCTSNAKSSTLPLRPPSAMATSRAESQPPRAKEKLPPVMAPRTLLNSYTPFDRASRGSITKSCSEFQPPVPPLRASTAPIPSDGTTSHSTQSIPPLPSLFPGSNHNILLQTSNQPRKQESLPALSQQQPSLNIHSYGTHYYPINNATNPAPCRRDGVWGDLMQLTEPTLSAASSGLHWTPTTTTTTTTYPYQPLTYLPSKTLLDNGMGQLMNGQSVAPNNPFSNQIHHPNTSFHPSSNHSFVPTFQPSNPFVNTVPSSSSTSTITSSKNPFLHLSSVDHSVPPPASSTSIPYPHRTAWSHPTPFF